MRGAMSADAERLVSECRAELAKSSATTWWPRRRREGARRRVDEIEAQIPAANARLGELALEERVAREQLAAFKEGLEARKVEAEPLGERMFRLASEVEIRKAVPKGLAQELRQISLRADELEGQIRAGQRGAGAARKERTEFSAELLRLAEQDEAAGLRETELAARADERKAQCEALARAARRRTAKRSARRVWSWKPGAGAG